MLSKKFSLRRPIVSLIGILLVVAMTAFLSVGISQASAARNTLNTLDEKFTTIALITAKYNKRGTTSEHEDALVVYSISQLPEEIKIWLSKVPKDNTDIVKAVASPGLASAYIPDLMVDLFAEHEYHGSISHIDPLAHDPEPLGAPYSCAVLEFVLTEIGEPTKTYLSVQQADGTIAKVEINVGLQIKGIITSVVGLHSGYGDPTGYNITISCSAQDLEEIESLNLTLGEKYIAYGMRYQDRDWTSDIKQVYFNIGNWFLNDEYVWTLNEDGAMIVESVNTEKSYIDENGETVICSVEEYSERYSVPTIAHVPDGVEAFLASDEGAEWRTALEHIEVNSHAFPVIGVQKLGYIADFARENARIVEGRDFTQKELDNGENVCIISATLAAKNGISVGDTIDMNYYIYDPSVPYQNYIKDGKGVIEPSAYFYTSTTGMAAEESYTIIGLYRDDFEWNYTKGDLYSFTPNTIFVPEASVTGSMDYSDQGLFKTYVLKNGSVAEFQKMVAEAGYSGLFVCYDQGYQVISESLYVYEEVAMRAMAVGISASIMLAVLYFILFPMQQKKNIAIMYSLGVSRKERISYLLGSNLCILLPGTVVGFVLSVGFWQLVSNILYSSANTDAYLTFETDVLLLLMIDIIQLACIFAVAVVLALLMTRERKMNPRE